MLDDSLTRYIWRNTKAQQGWVLLIVALSMIPYYLSFNLPKTIVNGPIQGAGFETETATQTVLRIAMPWFGGEELVLFPGMDLNRLQSLMALSAVFLLLVIVNGLFKFYINTYKGRLGEFLLQRLRFTLVDYVLRFPPHTFKRLKGAEVASMVKDEVEPLGGFAGDAFVSPALLGGQALTALVFIFVQSIPLGLITASLVAVQVFIIPRMRRRLLVLGRERQLTARQLAGRIGEIVEGIGTIHAYDTSNYERHDVMGRLDRIFTIRFDIYRWKFLVKFINNFLSSLTPFLFYSVGGYLALTGRLDIGQLVAVIGAYRDLPGPLKELIDWDQNRQDVEVKYQQVVSQFAVDGMLTPDIQAPIADPPAPLGQPIAAVNLGLTDDSGGAMLERVNLALQPGDEIAVVGATGSGGDVLAEIFARQTWPTSGKVSVGPDNLLTLPESATGRAISYAATDGYFFAGSLLDNLLYGLKNVSRPDAAACLPDDPDAAWIDYAALGVEGRAGLMARALEVLTCVQLVGDIEDLGLRSTISPQHHPALAANLLRIRSELRRVLQDRDLAGLVVPFEPGSYNPEATLLENLLFGHANRAEFMPDALARNADFLGFLQKHGLHDALSAMGVEIARNVISLFADLPPDHPFFRQLTYLQADDLPAYQLLLAKFDHPEKKMVQEDHAMMIRLAFAYVEPRDRFGLLDRAMMQRIVDVRQVLHAEMPPEPRAAIELYDPASYMASATLMDNMLFGRISRKYRDGAAQIRQILSELLEREALLDQIRLVGLGYDVGNGGKRLTQAQRQKLALARALIRPSEVFVFNRPLSLLDGRSQERIVQNILESLRKRARRPAVLWVLSNPGLARHFEKVALFHAGTLVETGTAEELSEKNGIFREMVAA